MPVIKGVRKVRSGGISIDEIYEALLDDSLFEELPSRLARALDARSAQLHWHYADGSADVISHSGYFSDAQLQQYAIEFAGLDPWAKATANLTSSGKPMNLEEVVSPEEYQRSAFYNDFIRGMGDDTYRCIGLRSDTRWGSGMIAVHRGKTQKSFSTEELSSLETYAPHLHRLLVLRGKISALGRRAKTASAALHLMRDAALLVSAHGRLLEANSAGEILLSEANGLFVRQGFLCAADSRDDQRLRQLISSACAQVPGGGTVLVKRRERPPLAIAITPLRSAVGARQTLLVVNQPLAEEKPLTFALQRLFRLTESEAKIAFHLAEGRTASEIAEQRKVSLATVRGQLKSVLSKLGCNRQAEVVILLNSIPLPGKNISS